MQEKLLKLSKMIKFHKKEFAIILGLAIFIVAMSLTCAFSVTKNIKVTIDDKTDSGATTKVINASLTSTLSDALAKEGVSIDDNYTVDQDLNSMTKDVDEVNIVKKVQGVCVADNKVYQYDSSAQTVGDVVKELGITLDDDDETSPSVDTQMTDQVTTIEVIRVDVKEETRTEEIPYETQKNVNANLDYGTTNVVTAGVNGTQEITDKVTYRNGVETNRETVSTTTTAEPVTQVEETGAKLPCGEVITTGHATTELSDSDFDMVCAVVRQEAGASYEGALAVISCMMNRVDQGRGSLVDVVTAPGQFAAYLDGAYVKYLGNTPEETKQAVRDCIYSGMRSHDYVNFRSYETSGSFNICGNWYFTTK